MIASSMHSSRDNPPNTTMFLRAGGGTPHKKNDQTTPVAQELTVVATVIASVLSPRVISSTASSVASGTT